MVVPLALLKAEPPVALVLGLVEAVARIQSSPYGCTLTGTEHSVVAHDRQW